MIGVDPGPSISESQEAEASIQSQKEFKTRANMDEYVANLVGESEGDLNLKEHDFSVFGGTNDNRSFSLNNLD